MIYKNGTWHYQGREYATLHDALVGAWEARK